MVRIITILSIHKISSRELWSKGKIAVEKESRATRLDETIDGSYYLFGRRLFFPEDDCVYKH